jgi:hypothetical protein
MLFSNDYALCMNTRDTGTSRAGMQWEPARGAPRVAAEKDLADAQRLQIHFTKGWTGWSPKSIGIPTS